MHTPSSHYILITYPLLCYLSLSVLIQLNHLHHYPVAPAFSLAAAIQAGDATAVSQVIGAVTSSLNAVDCSGANVTKCAHLHRNPCSDTARTCGTCMTGFLGTSGDANTPCRAPALLIPVGLNCNTSSQCLTGLCNVNSTCVEIPKPCPNHCHFNGTCAYFNGMGQPARFCASNDAFCQARCQCFPGYRGEDCSLTDAKMAVVQGIREQLCVGLYRTLANQDSTSDAMAAR